MVAQLDRRYVRTRPAKAMVRLVSYALFEGRPLTTRGRWINPLVFAWLRTARRLPRLRPVEAPVFIVGTGRSGTTVLGKVLSMHREVAFLNEPKAIWHTLHPGEDLIGNYTRAGARVALTEADATPELVDAAHRIYGSYLALTRSHRVVDKYPELVFRIPFVRAIFPGARFLFLVRDGYETCQSIDRWSEREGEMQDGEQHDWWGADGRKWQLYLDQLVPQEPDLAPHAAAIGRLTAGRDRATLEWILAMRAGLRARQDRPEDVHLVRYEDLATEDPRAALARLLQQAGLAPDPVMLDYAAGILAPAAARPPFELAEPLAAAFRQTMTALGYPAGATHPGRMAS